MYAVVRVQLVIFAHLERQILFHVALATIVLSGVPRLLKLVSGITASAILTQYQTRRPSVSVIQVIIAEMVPALYAQVGHTAEQVVYRRRDAQGFVWLDFIAPREVRQQRRCSVEGPLIFALLDRLGEDGFCWEEG